MIKIVTVEQMRAIERANDAAGLSYVEMMQHAGRGLAEVIKKTLGEYTSDRRVAFLIGPGNNGGDGLVAARLLKEETDAEVGCYLYQPRTEDDLVFVAARDAGVYIAVSQDDQRWRVLKNLVVNADIVVDALLGTGIHLPLRDDMKELLTSVTEALQGDALVEDLVWPALPEPPATRKTQRVIAVDCPSGLDCDTGDLDPATIPANITVTFEGVKAGQLIFPGAQVVGQLVVAGIGTPDDRPELQQIKVELATGAGVGRRLPPRLSFGHKGTFGRVVVVGGSQNYIGAIALAGQAAYRVGAGLVTLAVPASIYPTLAGHFMESTWLPLPDEGGVIGEPALLPFGEEVGDTGVWLVGPGLGRDPQTARFLHGLLRGEGLPDNFTHPLLVIDADGLNLLTSLDWWWWLLPENTVLTPHPGEMVRLAGLDAPPDYRQRIDLAREKAQEWGCVLVLKGANTVISAPDGRVMVIPFATDALATAGSGDVLAGAVTGLLAQGTPPFDAAVCGAYIHALAGQIAAEEQGNTRSVIAGDILRALSRALSQVENT